MNDLTTNNPVQQLFAAFPGINHLTIKYPDSQYLFIKTLNGVPWFQTIDTVNGTSADAGLRCLLVESNIPQSKFKELIKYLTDHRRQLINNFNSAPSLLYFHPQYPQALSFKLLFEQSKLTPELESLLCAEDLALRNLFESSPSLSMFRFSSLSGCRVVVNNRWIGFNLSHVDDVTAIAKELINSPEDEIDCENLVLTTKLLLKLNSRRTFRYDFVAYRYHYI